jgi:hypothetical protein
MGQSGFGISTGAGTTAGGTSLPPGGPRPGGARPGGARPGGARPSGGQTGVAQGYTTTGFNNALQNNRNKPDKEAQRSQFVANQLNAGRGNPRGTGFNQRMGSQTVGIGQAIPEATPAPVREHEVATKTVKDLEFQAKQQRAASRAGDTGAGNALQKTLKDLEKARQHQDQTALAKKRFVDPTNVARRRNVNRYGNEGMAGNQGALGKRLDKMVVGPVGFGGAGGIPAHPTGLPGGRTAGGSDDAFIATSNVTAGNIQDTNSNFVTQMMPTLKPGMGGIMGGGGKSKKDNIVDLLRQIRDCICKGNKSGPGAGPRTGPGTGAGAGGVGAAAGAAAAGATGTAAGAGAAGAGAAAGAAAAGATGTATGKPDWERDPRIANPAHDVRNPDAWKTNRGFQRRAKKEGWDEAKQKEMWGKEKEQYTINDTLRDPRIANPAHDVNNPDAYKTNRSFQRKFGDLKPGEQKEKWQEVKEDYTINDKMRDERLAPQHDINNPDAYKTNSSFQREFGDLKPGEQKEKWQEVKEDYTYQNDTPAPVPVPQEGQPGFIAQTTNTTPPPSGPTDPNQPRMEVNGLPATSETGISKTDQENPCCYRETESEKDTPAEITAARNENQQGKQNELEQSLGPLSLDTETIKAISAGFKTVLAEEFGVLTAALAQQKADAGVTEVKHTGKLDIGGLVKADVHGAVTIPEVKTLPDLVNGIIETYLKSAGLISNTQAAQSKPPTSNNGGGTK